MKEAGHSRDGSRDFRAIPWKAVDAHARHHRDRLQVASGIIKASSLPNIDDVVVVTHHPALAEVADFYAGLPIPWWAPGFYASDFAREIDQDVLAAVSLWISGHVHHAFDLTHGGTRFVGNPMDCNEFNPGLVIEMAQNAAFDAPPNETRSQ